MMWQIGKVDQSWALHKNSNRIGICMRIAIRIIHYMRLKVTLLCWLKMLTKEAEYRVILYFVVFFTIVSVILSGATREIFMKPVRL